MDKSAKITILGAGAIGCTVAARLILAGFNRVSLIARGDNLKQLQAEGIYLNDLTGTHQLHPYQVVEQATELGGQDVVFIATKAGALKQVTASINALLHDETVVIPLMNGIPFWYFYQNVDDPNASDSNAGAIQPVPIQSIDCLDADRYLIENFPLKHLIGAVVFITAELHGYGKVSSNNPYLLIFGEPSHQRTARVEQLQQLFTDTGIESRVHDSIRDQIWTKVIANLSSNPLSVLTGATLHDIYSHPFLHDVVSNMMLEARQVAACYGARINIDPKLFLKLGADMGEVHTSMWQDFQKKQPLELSGIADAVLELADFYDCPMPVTRQICQLTKYLSAKDLNVNDLDVKDLDAKGSTVGSISVSESNGGRSSSRDNSSEDSAPTESASHPSDCHQQQQKDGQSTEVTP